MVKREYFMSDEGTILKLIQGADMYAPEPLGKKDVLVTVDKIVKQFYNLKHKRRVS